MEAGAACGVAPGAVNHARRIEAGILSWGVDMTPDETPYDVGLDRLVEMEDTPDFIGRAALTALKDRPRKQTLVGLKVEGDALDPNEDLWPLAQDGSRVGVLTSLAYSPRLETNIALGRVSPDVADTGTQLTVDTWDGPRTAVVADLPFLPKRQQGNARDLLAEAGS